MSVLKVTITCDSLDLFLKKEGFYLNSKCKEIFTKLFDVLSSITSIEPYKELMVLMPAAVVYEKKSLKSERMYNQPPWCRIQKGWSKCEEQLEPLKKKVLKQQKGQKTND